MMELSLMGNWGSRNQEDMGDRKQKIQQRREEKGPTGTMVTVRYPGLTC